MPPALDIPFTIRVQTDDFDLSTESAALAGRAANSGAIVSFVGLVRGQVGAEALIEMALEHYPCMTESALHDIAKQAAMRWTLDGVTIIHRVGSLLPGAQIVLVLAASKHRKSAFLACEYIMDYLKTRAPFWKKETLASGSHWVDAREHDESALRRWEDADVS